MPVIEIICLANSRKHQGRCVAGLTTDGGGWIRPISNTPDGSLLAHHYTLTNGTEARVMDVLWMEVDQPRPENHHPENWIVGKAKWQLVRRAASIHDYKELFLRYRVQGPELLGNDADRV